MSTLILNKTTIQEQQSYVYKIGYDSIRLM